MIARALSIAGVVTLCALGALSAIRTAHADDTRSEDGWTVASPAYVWSFPRDHYAHPDFKTEWWYITGIVGDASGREFGYQVTWFRIGLSPEAEPVMSPWSTTHLVMAHAAIVDLQSGARVFDEVLHRAHPSLGGFGELPDARLAWCAGPSGSRTTWSMRRAGEATGTGTGERFVIDAGGVEGNNGFQLSLTAQRPRVFHGDGGYSRKSETSDAASHYYTHTRLLTEGTLTFQGETLPVSGTSWLDREFSSGQLDVGQVGWDWFAIRFADGRDLMAYRLRDESGATAATFGTLVGANGRITPLSRGSLSFKPEDTWTSDATGARYPVTWELTVGTERFRVEAAPADQENVSRGGAGISYWEGVVRAERIPPGLSGRGFLEMTGYDIGGSEALFRGLR